MSMCVKNVDMPCTSDLENGENPIVRQPSAYINTCTSRTLSSEESEGFDVQSQGPERWLLAVHLACVHAAWRMLGDLPQTSAGTLASMLCHVHGEAITEADADHLEQQIISALHDGLPIRSRGRKSFE